MNELKIYISYRKESGWELAKLIYDSLAENKFSVFLDSEQKKEVLTNSSEITKIKSLLKKYSIFIIVLTRDSLEKCVNSKDRFLNEIKTAVELYQNCNQDDKTISIIPIIDSRFAVTDKLKKQLSAEFEVLDFCNSIFINEKSLNYSINDLIKMINEIEFRSIYGSTNNLAQRVDNPKYLPNEIENKKLLTKKEIENRVFELEKYEKTKSYDFVKPIFQKIVEDYVEYCKESLTSDRTYTISNFNVLDIGCGECFLAKTLLGDNYWPINKYFGVDSNKNKLQVASKYFINNENKNKVHLYNLALHEKAPKADESDDKKFIDNLISSVQDTFVYSLMWKIYDLDKKSSARDGGDKAIQTKINIAHINFVLNNFKNPTPIIEGAKRLLDDNGLLIISEIDDGYDLYFPDNLGLFKAFKEIISYDSYMGNRFTGREVYNRLKDAGFKKIKLSNEWKISDFRLTPDQRLEIFNKQYSRLIKDFNSLLKKNPNYKRYNIAIKWLEDNYDKLKKVVSNPDFYWCRSFLIWSAIK